LFARLCAEIEFLDLSINDARIYSGTNGTTLDTFFVLKADGSPVPDDRVTLEKIRSSLQRALDSSRERSFTQRLPRRKKSFVIPTETSLYQDQNRGWSVLEVTTRDRPGLLAHIGSIFVSQGIGLQAAKIQTLGERVEDVFFITDRQGNMIQTQDTLDLLTTTIRDSLDEGVTTTS
jgi:[protein-PII] uridylyltransferase